MPDYSNTIIYKIHCDDVPEIYVGSTTNFNRRRTCHKCICNNENSKAYNLKVYKFIRDYGGWENWSMSIIDVCNLETKEQKLTLEREWIDKLGATLNSEVPGRTDKERTKEYRETNKVKLAEYKKEYRSANKESIAEKMNEKFDCECGGKYTHKNKSNHNKSKKHLKFIESQPSLNCD